MSTQASSIKNPAYLMGRSAAETRRLITQAEIYGPFTRRLLEEAGIEEGMSVLDVGTGAGDVSLIAAEIVGRKGSVTGVDQNPEVLKTASARAEAASLTNVSFVAEDFREAGFPYRAFDAVVGRLVLLYVPEPAEALRGLLEHLKPGGIVAFGEFNFTPQAVTTHPPTPLWESLWGWMQAAVQGAGLDPATGYHLRRIFLAAGLPEPEMALCAPVGGGPDWAGYEYAAESLRSMLPLILKLGVATEEEVQVDTLAARLRADTLQADGVVKAPELVAASSRKGHAR